jgi:hypothetical protein
MASHMTSHAPTTGRPTPTNLSDPNHAFCHRPQADMRWTFRLPLLQTRPRRILGTALEKPCSVLVLYHGFCRRRLLSVMRSVVQVRDYTARCSSLSSSQASLATKVRDYTARCSSLSISQHPIATNAGEGLHCTVLGFRLQFALDDADSCHAK